MTTKSTSLHNKNFKERFGDKTLLIESSQFISDIKVSKDLKESVKLSNGKAGTLIVRNIPVTVLNRENMNGRIYSTAVVQQAIEEASAEIASKQLLSQACEHPEGSFVAPTVASHVITSAYIKPNVEIVVEGEKGRFDVLFQDWEVLNTTEGKNLRALLEAECSIGTSIRGVGDMNGRNVENYTMLGTDVVGNPSSGTFSRMPVSESVILDIAKHDELNETFTVTTSSTNTVRDLEAAARIQDQLDGLGYGTVVKTSTKVNEETDPKTGAQTSITTLEAETSDDVAELDHALSMAKNAMLNGLVNVDSITIENIPEEGGMGESSTMIPMGEAAEEKPANKEVEEVEEAPKRYVLKTPNGFVAMNGNAIKFTEEPKDALHFMTGKEENGMVHLSQVQKILDAMGLFETERYYFSEGLDLGGTPMNDIQGQPVENAPMVEDNGSNTKYVASVETVDNNNMPKIDSVPISGNDIEGIVAEVSNLWDMKSQKGGKVTIKIIDTTTNENFVYDPANKRIITDAALTEDATELEQDGEKLSMEFDDGQTIEKEFGSQGAAATAQAGIESGKLSGNVMVQEDGEEAAPAANPNNLERGWYVAHPEVGVTGPFESKEEAIKGLEEYQDQLSFEFIESFDEAAPADDIEKGWYAGSKHAGVSGPFASEDEAWAGFDDYKDDVSVEYIDTLDEKVFSSPTDASDDYVEVPLNDSEETDDVVDLATNVMAMAF